MLKPSSKPWVLLALLPMLAAAAAAEAHDDFRALQPGEFVVREQDVPVRLVFIGYGRDQVDLDALQAVLPESYSPVVRFPRFYGLSGRDVGLRFHFRYQVVRKSRDFNDRF